MASKGIERIQRVFGLVIDPDAWSIFEEWLWHWSAQLTRKQPQMSATRKSRVRLRGPRHRKWHILRDLKRVGDALEVRALCGDLKEQRADSSVHLSLATPLNMVESCYKCKTEYARHNPSLVGEAAAAMHRLARHGVESAVYDRKHVLLSAESVELLVRLIEHRRR